MLSDGLTSLQAGGQAREEVEVLDVAQLLLASVQRSPAADPEAVQSEPEEGDVTQTADTVTDQREVGADASAHVEPDAEAEYAETVEAGGPTEPVGPSAPSGPDVAGGDDDPEESASEEDQPGHDSEPGVNEPSPVRKDD